MSTKTKSRYAVYKSVSNDTLVLPPVPLPPPRLPEGIPSSPKLEPRPKINLMEEILKQQIDQIRIGFVSSKSQFLTHLRIVEGQIVDTDPEARKKITGKKLVSQIIGYLDELEEVVDKHYGPQFPLQRMNSAAYAIELDKNIRDNILKLAKLITSKSYPEYSTTPTKTEFEEGYIQLLTETTVATFKPSDVPTPTPRPPVQTMVSQVFPHDVPRDPTAEEVLEGFLDAEQKDKDLEGFLDAEQKEKDHALLLEEEAKKKKKEKEER